MICVVYEHLLTHLAIIIWQLKLISSEGEKITITFEKRNQRVDDDEVDQWFEDNDKGND
mgnify:CR=1 FL=1